MIPEIKTKIKKPTGFSRYQALNVQSWSPLPPDFSQPGGQNFLKLALFSSSIPKLSSRAKMRPIPSLVESKPLGPKLSFSEFDDFGNHKKNFKTFLLTNFEATEFSQTKKFIYIKNLYFIFMVF